MLSEYQKKVLLGLSAVLSLRMFGISMVFPVFTLYAGEFTSVPFLLGIAFSGYALTQAIFQIPFGYLSDRYGRVKILFAGMLIFSAGSFLAAFPQNIYWLIFARFLQGMGAITSTVIAFISDVFQDEVRSRAMAIIGIAFSLSFSLGMPLGSYIAGKSGVSAIFLITGVLTACSSILIISTLKDKRDKGYAIESRNSKILNGLKTPNLLKMDLAGFISNFNLLAIFFIMPVVLSRYLVLEHFWRILLPMVITGMVISYTSAHFGDKGWRKEAGLAGFVLFIAGGMMLVKLNSIDSALFLFLVFTVMFSGFSILEAILPSMLTKIAHEDTVGTASGAFNMMQFMGSFMGGVVGGMLYFKSTMAFGLLIIFISAVGALLVMSIRKTEVSSMIPESM